MTRDERIARIAERFRTALRRTADLVGRLPPSERAAEKAVYDRGEDLHKALAGGDPAHHVNFMRNRDFFVGIARHDPRGSEKFLEQLPGQSELGLNELELYFDSLEKQLAAVEEEARSPGGII
jgi:hypothetical protein